MTLTIINSICPELVTNIFSLSSPFDVSSGLNHTLLAQKYYRDLGSRKGFQVHVYIDGVECDSSPFSSYNSATKALGLRSTKSALSRYIDSGKTFRGYIFKSTPLSSF
jgi:hypothetical protein